MANNETAPARMSAIDALIEQKRSEHLMQAGALKFGDVASAEKRQQLKVGSLRAEGAFNLLTNLKAKGFIVGAFEGDLPQDSLHVHFRTSIEQKIAETDSLDDIERNNGGIELLEWMLTQQMTFGRETAPVQEG